MKYRPPIVSAATILLTAVAFTGTASAAIPILEYKFNSDATSSGSVTTSLALQNSAVVGGASTGVSGSVSDSAMNLTAATGMGSAGSINAPAGFIDSRPVEINSMTSFTIQGWFKTDGTSVIGGNANLMTLSGPITLNSQSAGKLNLTVDGLSVQSATAAYNAQSTWTFFAVSYDGTLTSANVNFYAGTLSTAVTQVGTALTINAGVVGSAVSTADLVFGNSNGRDRGFDGFLDNIRLFGATSGAGGVLTMAELETLRSTDITIAAIPEPASYAAILAGFAGIAVCARRSRKATTRC